MTPVLAPGSSGISCLVLSKFLWAREYTLGGPSVKPYHPPGLYEQVTAGNGTNVYVEGTGKNLYRRSLYTYWKRSVPNPAMLAFDAPFRESCTLRRPRTNTPLQALNTLNDPTYLEAARFLAGRMLTEGGTEPESQLDLGFRLVLARAPQSEELSVLTNAYQRAVADFQNDVAAAEQLLEGREDRPHRALRFTVVWEGSGPPHTSDELVLVDLLDAWLDRRGLPPEVLHPCRELRLDVAPLPQARVGEEVLLAQAAQAALALKLPQLQERQEIGSLVGETRMALVGGRGALERPLARVLHRERRGDDAHLREAALLSCRHQHARHPRVEG